MKLLKTLKKQAFSAATKTSAIAFGEGVIRSYSQVFFSNQRSFAAILLPLSFVDFYTGLYGLLAVITAQMACRYFSFDAFRTHQGYYGFNPLLVGLGMGIWFEPGWLMVLMVILAALLTLFITISLEGVIGKYALPQLSLPFVLGLWAVMLASREFYYLGLNERGIYTFNELYLLGGHQLVALYEWWNALNLPPVLRSYFLSLGAIFFQYNVFTGLMISLGLLIYSRIAFSLSLLGFFTAFAFYHIIGAAFSEVAYSYIGFNYILTAIAIGGYFIIPGRQSYIWVMIIIPMVAILTVSLSGIMGVFYLPVYSLPFNLMALLFLYVLKFRHKQHHKLNTQFIQQHSPEKNLYAFQNHLRRFGSQRQVSLSLPFYGSWTVSQGHFGEHTHKGDWARAWDFEIMDESGKSFHGEGMLVSDYYCYDKAILAPAGGVVENILDGIPDNLIGQRNLRQNWGNTIVIKHADNLYTKLSHLKEGSFQVKKGEQVKRGQTLAKSGNSGNSPYPHLHFQVQSSQWIGSKTIHYPFSHYLLHDNKGVSLRSSGIPKINEKISGILPDSSLASAFDFTPGELIDLKVSLPGRADMIIAEGSWEVKKDEYLNTWLECEASACRAYFQKTEGMLYFTHFEGRMHSPLHYLYLAAFSLCLGPHKGLIINDQIPVNKVFHPHRMWLHDLLAPFYMYRSAIYRLSYPLLEESFAGTRAEINAQIDMFVFKEKAEQLNFSFLIQGDDPPLLRLRSKRNNWDIQWKKRSTP